MTEHEHGTGPDSLSLEEEHRLVEEYHRRVEQALGILAGIDEAIEGGETRILTRHNKIVGMFVPTDLGSLVAKAMENDPEWAAQVRASISTPGE